MRVGLLVVLVSGVVGAFFVACGSTSGTGANEGGDGGGGDGAADDAALPTNDVGAKNYGCPGCTDFPPLGTIECAPTVLGPATIAYPLDGLLLPPNMNVLEVQFVPPPGATLFEVDFYNAIAKVKVETKCTPVGFAAVT